MADMQAVVEEAMAHAIERMRRDRSNWVLLVFHWCGWTRSAIFPLDSTGSTD